MSSRINRRLVAAVLAALLAPTSILFAKPQVADGRHVIDLPKKAKQVVEEKDEGKYKLPADGQVWLYDVNDEKVLYTDSLNEGQTFAFNADQDRVYVNGVEGETFKIDNDHKYRIYFYTDEKTDKPRERAKDKETAHNNVPDTAKVVMEGRDKEFSYKAEKDGTAYLWDNTNNKVIETFNLHPDDRLTISPKSNAMAVNGKTVSRDTELSRKIEYKLLFDLKN